MSPVLPAAGSRVPITPVELISPSARKAATMLTPCSIPVQRLLSEQDDAHERKERRKSRLLEMQRNNMTSPATPSDRCADADLPKMLMPFNCSSCIYSYICIRMFFSHIFHHFIQLILKKQNNEFKWKMSICLGVSYKENVNRDAKGKIVAFKYQEERQNWSSEICNNFFNFKSMLWSPICHFKIRK